MSRSKPFALLVAFLLAAGAASCQRGEGEGDAGDPDTLAIDVPDEVEDRFEEGARAIGGRVGEVLEETGEAIEDAGERMQEEAGEGAAGDTTRM
jgi:hypothetical protein